jgi:hypothetical protein
MEGTERQNEPTRVLARQVTGLCVELLELPESYSCTIGLSVTVQFKPCPLARYSESGYNAGPLWYSSHQPMWTQSAKLIADSIGQEKVAEVSRLSGHSRLNSVLKRLPRSRCLVFGLEECWADICDTALCVPVLRGREHNGPAYHFHPLPPPPTPLTPSRYQLICPILCEAHSNTSFFHRTRCYLQSIQ